MEAKQLSLGEVEYKPRPVVKKIWFFLSDRERSGIRGSPTWQTKAACRVWNDLVRQAWRDRRSLKPQDWAHILKAIVEYVFDADERSVLSNRDAHLQLPPGGGDNDCSQNIPMLKIESGSVGNGQPLQLQGTTSSSRDLAACDQDKDSTTEARRHREIAAIFDDLLDAKGRSKLLPALRPIRRAEVDNGVAVTRTSGIREQEEKQKTLELEAIDGQDKWLASAERSATSLYEETFDEFLPPGFSSADFTATAEEIANAPLASAADADLVGSSRSGRKKTRLAAEQTTTNEDGNGKDVKSIDESRRSIDEGETATAAEIKPVGGRRSSRCKTRLQAKSAVVEPVETIFVKVDEKAAATTRFLQSSSDAVAIDSPKEEREDTKTRSLAALSGSEDASLPQPARKVHVGSRFSWLALPEVSGPPVDESDSANGSEDTGISRTSDTTNDVDHHQSAFYDERAGEKKNGPSVGQKKSPDDSHESSSSSLKKKPASLDDLVHMYRTSMSTWEVPGTLPESLLREGARTMRQRRMQRRAERMALSKN
ncbi:unnamed protein product, partial [Amoebophrya sp. A25]|eukprot:GSA25T00000820001.1